MERTTTMTADETRKGHLKITLDVEINEGLMEAAKDSMSSIAQVVPNVVSQVRGSMEKKPESK